MRHILRFLSVKSKSSGQSSVADACLTSWNTAVSIFGKMASSALQADLEAQSNVRCLDILVWNLRLTQLCEK